MCCRKKYCKKVKLNMVHYSPGLAWKDCTSQIVEFHVPYEHSLTTAMIAALVVPALLVFQPTRTSDWAPSWTACSGCAQTRWAQDGAPIRLLPCRDECCPLAGRPPWTRWCRCFRHGWSRYCGRGRRWPRHWFPSSGESSAASTSDGTPQRR